MQNFIKPIALKIMKRDKIIPFLILLIAAMLLVCACSNSGDAEPEAAESSAPSEERGAVPETEYIPSGDLIFIPESYDPNDETILDVPYGAFDADGNQILPYEYLGIVYHVAEDRYIVNNIVRETGTILIDGKGNEIVPSGYTLTGHDLDAEEGESAHSNWIVAKRNSDGMCGFIDPADGSFVIEPVYLNAEPFDEGFALVQNENNLWGVINEKAEYVIRPEYEMLAPYMGDECAAAATDSNGENVYFCKEGDEVWVMKPEVPVRSPSEFPELEFENGLALVMEDKGEDWDEPTGKYGVIDKHGKIVVPLEYDDMDYPLNYISSDHRQDD